MNSDFRVQVGFADHPKTKKLIRRVGYRAAFGLGRIWAHAAQHKPDGRLTDMTIEDIELVADWDPERPGELVPVLEELRWLDRDGDTYLLHDWQEHNPFAASSQERSEHARKAAQERWAKKSNAASIEEHCGGHKRVLRGAQAGNAPSVPIVPIRTKDDLDVWIEETFFPAFPTESQCQLKSARRELLKVNPDQAARDALVARVKAWTPVWNASGRHPGVHSFITEGKYSQDPQVQPANGNGPAPRNLPTGADLAARDQQ